MSHSHLMRTMLAAAAVSGLAVAGVALAQQQAQQQSASPTQPAASGYSNPATQMPAVIPSKSENAMSAFEKLDSAHLGYVAKEQVAKLDGFDKAFAEADKNKDGKLSQDEFRAAWAIYTGNTKG
jgi:EF hand